MQESTFKLEDLVDFALKYRKDNVFKDWTTDHLAYEFFICLKKGTLFYFVDERNAINGVITWDNCIDTHGRSFVYIRNCLTTERCLLPRFYSHSKKIGLIYDYIVGRRKNRQTFYKYEFRAESLRCVGPYDMVGIKST